MKRCELHDFIILQCQQIFELKSKKIYRKYQFLPSAWGIFSI